MAAARFCMSRLRIGAWPAISRYGDKSLRAAGRIQRGWTGGAFTAGVAITAARSDSWTAATAPAPADPVLSSDQMLKDNAHVGGCVTGEWFQVPELSLRDHYFVVPLDHENPDGPSITIFVREVVGVGKEGKFLPCLLFLQGGPGFECARPTEAGGWVKKACEEYRVILLDQRGTGLSTPLTTTALAQFASPKQQAAYLRNFRADSIVKDAEIVRSYLVPDGESWSVLGQSYGGFCAVTYLSMAPHGLDHVLLTGGLPPIGDGCTAETVYRACYKRVALQNAKYYKRFPGDAEIVRSVVLHLAQSEGGGVPLPSGGFLTPRGLQLLGLSGLGSSGGLERLHYLFERAWDSILVDGAKKTLSYNFLRAIDNWSDYDTNPLYAIMHESIYCQHCIDFDDKHVALEVDEGVASKWAAHRVREELGEQFDAVKAASNGTQVLFTGEMIFPWMFDDMAALRPFKEAANIIAETTDWPPLYNKKQLNENKVPVAAAVYYEDLYVNIALSEETAAQIKDIRLWVTNEYLHSGIREDGARILDQLFGMLKGKYPIR